MCLKLQWTDTLLSAGFVKALYASRTSFLTHNRKVDLFLEK